jgi:hypothetical protein
MHIVSILISVRTMTTMQYDSKNQFKLYICEHINILFN